MDWLDLARYADTYGYQADVDRDMSPYRDWVIRAFNGNLPYDQFLTWQLAGDLLPNATRDQRIATAFNRLHRQTNEGGSVEEEFRTEYVADRVNTFGTAMLGLTLECARCHDHKFDPITQRDYFSLFAFFNNIDESGLYSHFTNATPTPSLLLWPAGTGARARSADGDASRATEGARSARCRARPAKPRSTPGERRAPISAAGAGRASGVRRGRSATRRRIACWRAGASCRMAPTLVRRSSTAARCGSAATTRRAPGRADVRAHRSVLAGDPAACRPSAAARGRRCTSRAPGPTPAAAASS